MEKNFVEKIKKVESEFKVDPKLFIKNYTFKRTTFKNWLQAYFSTYNKKNETVYEDGKYQCAANKNRSLHDIYNTARSYFPRLTLQKLMSTIVELQKEGRTKVLYCPVIKKRVFFKKQWNWNGWGQQGTVHYKHYPNGVDEHGFSGDDYLSLAKKEKKDEQ